MIPPVNNNRGLTIDRLNSILFLLKKELKKQNKTCKKQTTWSDVEEGWRLLTSKCCLHATELMEAIYCR